MAPAFGAAFLALLLYGHAVDPQGDALLRPLSLFRDVEPEWIGYALFGALLGLGAATVRTALRVECEGQAALYVFATAILAAVTATPSNDLWHLEFSVMMMAAMFINFAVLLYLNDQMFWMVMHLLTPTVLMWATNLVSYGLWQKCLILYFLAATVAHERVMIQWLPKQGKRRVKKVKVWVGMRRMPGIELGTSYLS
jgi:hypothetical protein